MEVGFRKVAVIGSTGFVGNALTHRLLQDPEISHISLVARDIGSPKLNAFRDQSAISLYQADILDFPALQVAVESVDTVFVTAGLAWQHPGQKHMSPQELMVEQLVQNAVGALSIARLENPNRRIIWTSTNAIDTMLARLEPTHLEEFNREIASVAEAICSTIQPDASNVSGYLAEIRSIIQKIIPGEFPTHPESKILVRFSEEYSYAYSKLVGQEIFEKLSKGNTLVLKISDVYGKGQDISSEILNPKLPARRLQRFMAAHKAIQQGDTQWIPSWKDSLHGFSLKNGQIIHEAWNDDVFPTHIEDVVSMLIAAGKIDHVSKCVFHVSGRRVPNKQMAEVVRDAFDTDVQVIEQSTSFIEVPERSEDLQTFGLNPDSLISLEQGVRQWVSDIS